MLDIADLVTGAEMKLKNMDPAKLAALSPKLDVSFDEWTAWQQTKSLAQADGRLSYENACYFYSQLGSGPDDFNSRPLAVKIILTQVVAELLRPGA